MKEIKRIKSSFKIIRYKQFMPKKGKFIMINNRIDVLTITFNLWIILSVRNKSRTRTSLSQIKTYVQV